MNEPQRHRATELQELNVLTSRIIARAIEVHRHLGPGLLEYRYESALCIELEETGIRYLRQLRVPALYKGRVLGEYRVDLVVGDAVMVEVKYVSQRNPNTPTRRFKRFVCSSVFASRAAGFAGGRATL
jgi:GxxExxY protein